MRRGGWSLEALALIEQANRAGADAGGAGGAAPAVGGVTHPLQSAAPAPPAQLDLALLPVPKGADALWVAGSIHAFSRADLEGASPDRPVLDVHPVGARCAPPPSDGPVQCVARGADSLALAVYAQLDEGRVASLLELLRLARERGDEQPVYLATAAGLTFRVTWARSPYAVALVSPAAQIRVMRAQRGQGPQVHLEVRSALLWRDGLVAAVDSLIALVRSWEVPRVKATRVDVSRLDLAADFTGLTFTGAEVARGRWVCRARSRAAFTRAGRASTPKDKARAAELRRDQDRDRDGVTYQHGRTHTGGMFGAGAVVVRYYLKTLEIKRSGKAWMRSIWAAAGWDGTAPVWRVEAQIRGDALGAMLARAPGRTSSSSGDEWRPGAVTYGKSWSAVLRSLDAIWRYTVGDPAGEGGHGWLSLRDESPSEQVTRWPVSAQWRAVQAVTWGAVSQVYGAEGVGVYRLRSRVSADHVDRMAALEGRGAVVPWQPSFALRVEGPALADLAHAVSGRDALDEWGHGPTTRRDADDLAAVGAQSDPPMDLDAAAAADRRRMLEDQLVGVALALAAVRDIERRELTEDVGGVADVVAERLRDLLGVDPDAALRKMQAARAQGAMRGAVGYRLELARAGFIHAHHLLHDAGGRSRDALERPDDEGEA